MKHKKETMITLEMLKEVESSFSVVSASKDNIQVKALCTCGQICEDGMVFIKNHSYHRKFLRQTSENNMVAIGATLQKKYFLKLSDSEKNELSKRLSFLATVDLVDEAICRFSKIFYDRQNQKFDDSNDGRSKGTVNIHPSSVIAPNVFLGQGVVIGAGAVLHSGCVILSGSMVGKGAVLYPNVVVYRNVVIGSDCRIHANTTIGSDGFGYVSCKGRHLKVWHFGGVVIGSNVEIGSNVSIDQGTFSPTVIGAGTKIDNQVQIAHNCHLGTNGIICGLAGLAGSVRIGDNVIVGGGASITQNVEIGNNASIGGTAGVTRSVPENASYGGYPARPINEFLKTQAVLRKLSKNGKDISWEG